MQIDHRGLAAWRRYAPLLCLVQALAGCHRQATPAASPPTRVDVVHAVARQVQAMLVLTGTLSAARSVDLVARVPGTLTRIGFVDGALVKQGQLLFEIEPDTYRAQLASDQAVLDKAEQELARQQQLIVTNATSQLSLQSAQSARDQALAKRDMSRIQLGYTRIVAPFDGRVGAHLVDVGNLVGAGAATRLATVQSSSPLYVNFTVNERDAGPLGLLAGRGKTALPGVSLTQPGSTASEGATLDFIDSGIDAASAALRLRATVASAATGLVPGMFVQVHLTSGKPHAAWLVPQRAVLTDQAGAAVLVVDAAQQVVRREVTAGAVHGQLREVTGIDATARVIADGGVDVRAGQRVQAAP